MQITKFFELNKTKKRTHNSELITCVLNSYITWKSIKIVFYRNSSLVPSSGANVSVPFRITFLAL